MQLRKLLHTLSCSLALVLTTACDPPDEPDMPPGAGTLPFADAPDELDESDEPDDDHDPPPRHPAKRLTNAPGQADAIADDHYPDDLVDVPRDPDAHDLDDLVDVPHDPDDPPPEDRLDAPHSPTDPPAPNHPEDLTDR